MYVCIHHHHNSDQVLCLKSLYIVQIHHHHLSQSVFLFMFVQRHHYQIQIEIHHHYSQSVNLFMCAPASILARVVSAQALEEKSFEVIW